MRGLSLLLAVACVAVQTGCECPAMFRRVTSPVRAGLNPGDLIDPPAQAESDQRIQTAELHRIMETLRTAARPAVEPPKRSVLVLSGGGSYGSYAAGVLCGWSEAGTRPDFDVVTGISTGALIAPFAFLGTKYDAEMQRFYTTLKNDDLYRIKKSLRTLLSEALADNRPLAQMVEKRITLDVLKEIASEHARGRRLYVGTTELEGRRQVVWDMGAIASRGTDEDLKLFHQVLLGSAAIPGFFPPSRIPITVDGKRYIERHVDGGVSAALFFRPPYIPHECRDEPAFGSLYGTDVYAIVAGKLYADPEKVRKLALSVAATSVPALIAAQTRGDLSRLFTICLMTGMNYHMTAIPAGYPYLPPSTEFKPAEMKALFDEGVRQVRLGTVWRKSPPGVEPGESPLERSGTALNQVPRVTPVPVK